MIDADGFRHNVGIILTSKAQEVFWARRIGQNAWQFPQGGLNENESPEEALFRELNEEVGLSSEDVTVIAETNDWYKYRLPRKLVRHDSLPVCVGQKQKWFLLELKADETKIRFDQGLHPEFDGWRWVSYWFPLQQVVAFKRSVYRSVLTEFAPYVVGTPDESQCHLDIIS